MGSFLIFGRVQADGKGATQLREHELPVVGHSGGIDVATVQLNAPAAFDWVDPEALDPPFGAAGGSGRALAV